MTAAMTRMSRNLRAEIEVLEMDGLRRHWTTVRAWWLVVTFVLGLTLRGAGHPVSGIGLLILGLVALAIATFVVDPKRIAEER